MMNFIKEWEIKELLIHKRCDGLNLLLNSYYHNGNLNLAIEDLKKACALGHKEACEKLQQFRLLKNL